jgi:leader peptidase (prepilin peptidase) / N-methyltransferase
VAETAMLMQQHPWLSALAGLLLGLLIGSHLAVLSLATGRQTSARLRSRCPQCRQILQPLELIPLLGWLWQAGRCRHCHAGISLRYPAIELLTGLISMIVVWRLGWQIATPAVLLLSWLLILMSWIDAERLELPDPLTLGALWWGLLCSLLPVGVDPATAILGAACGYLSLWTVYQLHHWLTAREGMGYGDFKLFAAIGAWTGADGLPGVLVVAATLALAHAALRWLLLRTASDVPIPFGPFLAAAGWFAILGRHGIMV